MRARVNEKLYFARLMLDQAQASDGAAREALLQAAVFHLAVAYRCYLREISGRTPVENAPDARAALTFTADQAIPELAELAALEQAGAWPARLLAAHAEICQPSPVSAAVALQDHAIALADVTDRLAIDTCRAWLESFQSVLSAQRERLQEW